MDPISILIGAGAGLIVGGIIIWIIQSNLQKGKGIGIIQKAEAEGENIKKEKLLQAKEKFLQLKEEHEKAVNERERKVQSNEDRIKSKEKDITRKLEDVTKVEKENLQQKEQLTNQLNSLNKKKEEVDKAHQKMVAELEKISGYTAEEAKSQLVDALKNEEINTIFA